MNILWGIIMVGVGIFMLVCGRLKSQFFLYRLMIARSKILWGQNVHLFYQIAGVIIIIVGVIVALGNI